MIVQVNGENHHMDREALCALSKLGPLTVPPDTLAKDVQAIHGLISALQRYEAETELTGQRPCFRDDGFDGDAPMRVFIAKDDNQTVLFRVSFGDLQGTTYAPFSRLDRGAGGVDAVDALMAALGIEAGS